MEEWLQKSRIYRIQGLSRQVWYTGLWYFLMLFVIVGLGAVVSSSNGDATETETTGEFRSARPYHDLLDPWMTFPNGTYNYQGSQSDVPQMCKLESFGDSEGQGALNHLADYAFLCECSRRQHSMNCGVFLPCQQLLYRSFLQPIFRILRWILFSHF